MDMEITFAMIKPDVMNEGRMLAFLHHMNEKANHLKVAGCHMEGSPHGVAPGQTNVFHWGVSSKWTQ